MSRKQRKFDMIHSNPSLRKALADPDSVDHFLDHLQPHQPFTTSD
jgi:hypothetical protein